MGPEFLDGPRGVASSIVKIASFGAFRLPIYLCPQAKTPAVHAKPVAVAAPDAEVSTAIVSV